MTHEDEKRLAALLLLGALGAAAAPAPVVTETPAQSGRIAVYDYGALRLHVLFSDDAMADVACIVEGEKALAGIEMPAFSADITVWKNCVKQLGKPMEGVLVSCHPGSVSSLKGIPVYGTGGATRSLTAGMTAAIMQGISKAFGPDFLGGETAAPIDKIVSGRVTLAGVEFALPDRGETFDGAIPAINVVYTHMLGKATHSILTSPAHIDAFLAMVEEYRDAGYDMVVTSHGGPEGQDAVAEKAAYLKKAKELAAASGSAEAFRSAMKEAFPGYSGENYLDMSAGALFPAK